jgi:UDP-N-acetylmuramate dehydrogenase
MLDLTKIINIATLRGKLRQSVALANRTWFRVGGEAQWLFTPEDAEDLSQFMRMLPDDVLVTTIGVGSNLLVRDGGIEGVVIRLGRDFAAIDCNDDIIIAGAAALDVNVSNVALQNKLSGFEFLSGIPGTIGGAVRMNAGAYGDDISQIAKLIYAIDRGGNDHCIDAVQAGFSYRKSQIPADWIVTKLQMQSHKKADYDEIKSKIDNIMTERGLSQPVKSRTGGSTFKNPPNMKAWQLIDEAGCRGLSLGGAQISPLHCNFMINNGNATAHELERLGEMVREKVFNKTGIILEWEIKIIGIE